MEECGLFKTKDYIWKHRQMFVAYVVDCLMSTAYRGGEQRQGTPCHQWWWEQEMDLDEQPLISEASYDGSDSLGTFGGMGG